MVRIVMGLMLWVATLALCMGFLVSYERTAGAVGIGSDLQLGDDSQSASLRMFLHPRCPCSAASVAELGRLLAQVPESTRCEVWFYRPAGEADTWAHSETFKAAASLRGVRVHTDPGGLETTRNSALTSGTVVARGPDGRIGFVGGITPARGHEGPAPGQQAVLEALAGRVAEATAPVFGCLIVEPMCTEAPCANEVSTP